MGKNFLRKQAEGFRQRHDRAVQVACSSPDLYEGVNIPRGVALEAVAVAGAAVAVEADVWISVYEAGPASVYHGLVHVGDLVGSQADAARVEAGDRHQVAA